MGHVALVVVAMFGVTPVFGETGAGRVGRIQTRDAAVKFFIEQGRAQSATFNGLVSVLESSDLMVTVSLQVAAGNGPSGELRFIGTSGDLRQVQIVLRAGTASWTTMLARHRELIAILGHELQHAAEVAATPEVADAGTFGELYRRIGIAVDTASFDTSAAQRAGAKVDAELRQFRK